MTIYVYLHGFNSGFTRENPKVPALEAIGEDVGITYDTTATIDMAFGQIMNELAKLEDLDDTVLVGTSLGAFYAAEVSRLVGLPAILINPCVNPGTSLRKYVNQLHKNFVTGVESFFGDNTLSTYGDDVIRPYHRIKPLVLLDRGDEIIDATETFRFMKRTYDIDAVMFEGGSHRFDHMDEALEYIKAYSNNVALVDGTI